MKTPSRKMRHRNSQSLSRGVAQDENPPRQKRRFQRHNSQKTIQLHTMLHLRIQRPDRGAAQAESPSRQMQRYRRHNCQRRWTSTRRSMTN